MQKQGSLPDVFDWESEGGASSEGLPVVISTSRGKIIGRHPSIRGVLATLDRVARSNCTVLVTGESGTGKELAVAALHDASLRSKKSLVAVNCGAIPENLIESELFGHARGAFTGAHAARQGWVAAAEGGSGSTTSPRRGRRRPRMSSFYAACCFGRSSTTPRSRRKSSRERPSRRACTGMSSPGSR